MFFRDQKSNKISHKKHLQNKQPHLIFKVRNIVFQIEKLPRISKILAILSILLIFYLTDFEKNTMCSLGRFKVRDFFIQLNWKWNWLLYSSPPLRQKRTISLEEVLSGHTLSLTSFHYRKISETYIDADINIRELEITLVKKWERHFVELDELSAKIGPVRDLKTALWRCGAHKKLR